MFNYYIVLKKITTNTTLQGSQFDIAIGSHASRAQPTDYQLKVNCYTLTVFSLNFSPAVRDHS